jgi:hypothetical protein
MRYRPVGGSTGVPAALSIRNDGPSFGHDLSPELLGLGELPT